MKGELISYKLADAEFVAGENELCFKKVLDTFENAAYINILTYNISSNSDTLLDRIKQVGNKDVPINIITNIPSRWPFYRGDSSIKAARRNIAIYERKLDPKHIGSFAQIFFKFNNHGKIVMTDKAVYWGSANYSDESKKNYECGTISTDKKFIRFLNEEVFMPLISKATSYYSLEYNECLMALYSALSLIHNIHQEIVDASFDEWADYDTNFEPVKVFNKFDNYLSNEMLDRYLGSLEELEEIVQNLEYNLIENEKEYDEKKLCDLILKYEDYMKRQIKKIQHQCKKIEPLTEFDEEDYVNNLLSEEFYSEAYDENLDYYAQKSFDMGREMKQELIDNAEGSIKSLLSLLDEFENKMISFIDQVMVLAKANEMIDNT